MHAFVLDRNRKPLTPCRMARARILLKLGRAAVFRRFPFTIILQDRADGPAAHEHRIKIDPGSKTTGVAIVQDETGRVVAAVEIEHRGQSILRGSPSLRGLSLCESLTVVAALIASVGMGLAAQLARRRGLGRWLVPYALQSRKRRGPHRGDEVHVLLCIADHYESHNGGVPDATARARVGRWIEKYPRLLGGFRDSDGRPPRHTFFYPIEQYDPTELDALAELCRLGFGEVEMHLHHDRDTPEGLRQRLLASKELLARRHGLLSRHRGTGELAYGFVHGNWALDNSRPDGCWCGVNNELDILRETGCYADFTLPSAPSPTQTRTINRIYYARDDPHRPKSHDSGVDVGTGPAPADTLMLIQGPLLLNWRRRKWGLLPRIENGCIQANQPPSIERLDLWLKARVQVPNRPDWFFVKLHTHGAPEPNQRVLLGEPMVRFHRALARCAEEDERFHFHYVTAREMYNLVRAAEAGWEGPIAPARDFLLVSKDPTAQAGGLKLKDFEHFEQAQGL